MLIIVIFLFYFKIHFRDFSLIGKVVAFLSKQYQFESDKSLKIIVLTFVI
jgi:hypothetical protein